MELEKRRIEHIREMLKTGRVYSKEEVRSMAAEILEYRECDLPTSEKVIVVEKHPIDPVGKDYMVFLHMDPGDIRYFMWSGNLYATVRIR